MSTKMIIRVIALTVCFLVLGSTIALALDFNYSFHFVPPFPGSARYTGSYNANGASAYVDPSGTTLATTYVLMLPAPRTTTVSNFRTSSSAKMIFTYTDGYGGAGQPYRMCGYPYYYDFQEYTAPGKWKP